MYCLLMPRNRNSIPMLLEQIGKEQGMYCSFDVCESENNEFIPFSVDTEYITTIRKKIYTSYKLASIDVTLMGVPNKDAEKISDAFESVAKSIEYKFNPSRRQPSNCFIHIEEFEPNKNDVSLTCYYKFKGRTKDKLEKEFETFSDSFFDEISELGKIL